LHCKIVHTQIPDGDLKVAATKAARDHGFAALGADVGGGTFSARALMVISSGAAGWSFVLTTTAKPPL